MNQVIHNMNTISERLNQVAAKKHKLALGLMSGTSGDGLDVALSRIGGADFETQVELVHFTTINYPEPLQKRIRGVAFQEQASLQNLCVLNRDLGKWFGRITRKTLNDWRTDPLEVDFIASHGQTIYHKPADSTDPAATLQLGDGDQIARQTGVLTLSDFRQKLIAAGGEGAPITPFVDRLLFSSPDEPRLLLNIGGIANFTWLGASDRSPSDIDYIYSDTGPGNTLIDAATRHFFPGKPFDPDGAIAGRGEVDEQVLDQLMGHPFFDRDIPKSTGPEAFNFDWVWDILESIDQQDMDAYDLVATLTRFTTESIARSIEKLGDRFENTGKMYVSGGGIHNRTLLDGLKGRLPSLSIDDFSALGLDPDTREAVSFAVLGNQTLSGRGIPYQHDKSDQLVKPGKISFPS